VETEFAKNARGQKAQNPGRERGLIPPDFAGIRLPDEKEAMVRIIFWRGERLVGPITSRVLEHFAERDNYAQILKLAQNLAPVLNIKYC
jgi:hypothetical protein